MRNPTRRSNKIGLTQGGRVKDGCAVEKSSRSRHHNIWKLLSEPRNDSDADILFITENPSRDYYHPCDEDDLRRLFKLLPRNDVKKIKAIVFRRTTTKDKQRWVEARRRYSCIILNPFPIRNELDWGDQPPSESVRSHYRPWCDRWTTRDGRHIQVWDPDEVRRYYRFHLFLHELRHLNQPDFHSLTRREDFAEDYALSWARKLGQLV